MNKISKTKEKRQRILKEIEEHKVMENTESIKFILKVLEDKDVSSFIGNYK